MATEKEPNYWDDVRDHARDIFDRFQAGEFSEDGEISNAIFETVNSCGWIIYYGSNEEVLDDTDNYPDDRCVHDLIDPERAADWRYVRQVCAFEAMRGDIYDEVERLKEDLETDDDMAD